MHLLLDPIALPSCDTNPRWRLAKKRRDWKRASQNEEDSRPAPQFNPINAAASDTPKKCQRIDPKTPKNKPKSGRKDTRGGKDHDTGEDVWQICGFGQGIRISVYSLLRLAQYPDEDEVKEPR